MRNFIWNVLFVVFAVGHCVSSNSAASDVDADSSHQKNTVVPGEIDTRHITQLADELAASDFQTRWDVLGSVAKLIPRQAGGKSDFKPLVEPLFRRCGWGGIARRDSRLAEELIVRIGASAIPFLRTQLSSTDGRERRVAASLLFQIGPQNEELATLLLELLTDRDQFVHNTVVECIGKIGPAAKVAVPDLEQIAEHAPIIRDRVAAQIALIQIIGTSQERIRELATFLEGDEPNVDAAWLSMRGLRSLGQKARFVEPQLLAAMNHPDLRGDVAATLGDINADSPETVSALIDLLQDDRARGDRRSAAGALGRIGPKAKAAIPGLAAVLREQDHGGWWIAADALGKIGGAEVVPILQQALENEDAEIRLAAICSLGELGTIANPAVMDLAKSRDHDPRELNRPAAAESLKKIAMANER